MKTFFYFVVACLIIGCSSSVPVEGHEWARYSIKKFQILNTSIVCDGSNCIEKMETIRDAAFVPGEYWSKKTLEWNTQWALEKGVFAKPVVFVRDGKSIFITFCDDKYFVQFDFDSKGQSKIKEPLLYTINRKSASSLIDHEYRTAESFGYELNDTLITISALNGKIQYRFVVDEKTNAHPELGKKLEFATPFDVFPEKYCKEEILPLDSRF